MRAIVYARTSYDDRDNDDQNLNSQLAMGRDFCEKKGYDVIAEMAEDDKGASGANLDLPQLSKILEMAAARMFDILIVRDLCRLSRSVGKLSIIKRELKADSVKIEFVRAEFPDTPDGRLLQNMMASIAEYEREEINWRMMNGRRNTVNAGYVVLNSPPFGYRSHREAKGDKLGHLKLEVYLSEAEIVRQIYEWYAISLVPIREIAHRLDVKNIDKPLTKGRQREAGWPPSTVRLILRNSVYSGKWNYIFDKNKLFPEGTKQYIVDVPGIVDEGLFKAAQALLDENQEKRVRTPRYEYLLSRRLTCGVCHRTMVCYPAAWNGKRYLYYVCIGPEANRLHSCSGIRARADELDSLAWNWVKSLLEDPARLREEIDLYRSRTELQNAPILRHLQTARELIAEKRGQLNRLVDLYVNGMFKMEDLQERKARLEQEIAAFEAQQAGLEKSIEGQIFTQDEVDDLQAFAAEIHDRLDDPTFDQKRQLFHMLNVTGWVVLEDGNRVFNVQCRISPHTQSFMLDNTLSH